ncbi:hypothetical protein C0J52_03100 [Blattella germanica]|nr:hypothetical protein C0J52_03100 [Blattella germanica]
MTVNQCFKIYPDDPAGVFILENSNIQYEVCTGVPFAFSMTFSDEPDRKHLFSGRSEENINQWVNAMKQATYGHWRSQLIILQTKINAKTGKDPLLMYPHNQGTVRDFQSHHGSKSIGSRSSSFYCHLQQTADIAKEGKKSFKSHIKIMETSKDTNFCQNHPQQRSVREEKRVHVPSEINLIEL